MPMLPSLRWFETDNARDATLLDRCCAHAFLCNTSQVIGVGSALFSAWVICRAIPTISGGRSVAVGDTYLSKSNHDRARFSRAALRARACSPRRSTSSVTRRKSTRNTIRPLRKTQTADNASESWRPMGPPKTLSRSGPHQAHKIPVQRTPHRIG